jgi:hypothetical protein
MNPKSDTDFLQVKQAHGSAISILRFGNVLSSLKSIFDLGSTCALYGISPLRCMAIDKSETFTGTVPYTKR